MSSTVFFFFCRVKRESWKGRLEYLLNFYKLWTLGGSPSHRMVMGKKKTKKKFIQISELSGIALTSMELHLNYWLLYVGCYMHGMHWWYCNFLLHSWRVPSHSCHVSQVCDCSLMCVFWPSRRKLYRISNMRGPGPLFRVYMLWATFQNIWTWLNRKVIILWLLQKSIFPNPMFRQNVCS